MGGITQTGEMEMSDQDRITVNGVELVRKPRTGPSHCSQCVAYGDSELCVLLPCDSGSYFVRVKP